MLTLKRARLWFISLVVVATIINIVSPLLPKAYADTATAVDFNTKNLPFIRINRTLITIGNASSGVAWFYSADPLGNNYVYNSVGLTCPATLTYTPQTGAGATIPSSWAVTWTSPYKSQDGCQTVKSTVSRNDDPKNDGANERYWTVFYRNGDKINSVLKDNKTTFTKYATAVMPTGTPEQYAYIEDGVQAVDCPSVIRFSQFDNKWAYIPMTKATDTKQASDQYRTLMNKAFGTPEPDVNCTPIEKDDLGLLKRFGLPESYYDYNYTLNTGTHDILTDFGFREAGDHSQNNVNSNLRGAELLGGIPDKEAQGIGANGDFANGSGIGTGGGVVDETAAGGTKDKPTCTIDGIGWAVCPVTTFLANVADGAMGMLNDFFKVPASKIFDTGNDTYKIWQQVRNYANILFVIAFLIIIFSQVTSIGITNYGIKKLLPKLILTAVLVNVSFPICAILVDLSNLLGYGLSSFMGTSISNATGISKDANAWNQGSVFGGIAATALILGATVVAAYFALATLVGVLISVIAIGVTMVILLGIRQALVILLVVISPLAFVALLLPNTESLFRKWLNLFKSMLLIFPIASLLYGAGLLASKILMQTSDNTIVQTIGASLPVVMLIAIYKVFNNTMNAVNGVGDFANGLRKGINNMGSPLKNLASKNDQLNKQKFMAGDSMFGTRKLGQFVNRRVASYDNKMQTAKEQAGANAKEFIRDDKRMQRYTNRTAEAVQRTENANKEIKNQGERHLQGTPGGQQLIRQEGELTEEARRLSGDRRSMQIQDAQTRAKFIQANASELAAKEEEGKRDADWKETVARDVGLVNQTARIEGQKLRGEAAEAVTDSKVKEQIADGRLSVANGDGQAVDIDDVRATKQTAEAEIKRSEAEIKAKDSIRAASDDTLVKVREETQDAEAMTKAAEADIKSQDTARLANATPDTTLGEAQNLTLRREMETKRSEAQIQAQEEEKVATDKDLVEVANETRAEQNRAGEAKRVQTSNYRDAVLNNPDIIDIAGGQIPGQQEAARKRIQDAARAEVSKARGEVVTNARIQFETQPNNAGAVSIATTGMRSDGTSASSEEIEAASLHLLEKGSHGEKLDVIRQIAASTAGLPPDQQQVVRASVADAYVRSSLADLGGKNFAAEIRNPSTTPSIDAQIRSNLGTLKPESLAKDSKYAETVLQLYTTGTAAEKAAMEPMLNSIVTAIRGNSTLSSSADPKTKGLVDSLTTAMGPAYTGSPTWS